MTRLKAHFDGARRVIVPDEPVDLGPDEKVIIHIEKVNDDNLGVDAGGKRGLTGAELVALVQTLNFDEQSIREMEEALKDCSRVDLDGW